MGKMFGHHVRCEFATIDVVAYGFRLVAVSGHFVLPD